MKLLKTILILAVLAILLIASPLPVAATRSEKPTETYLRGFPVHTRAVAQADGPLEFPSSSTIPT